MKITREDTAPREVVLTIELESADLEPYLDRSYKRLVNKLQIPGFRRGKAPKFIVGKPRWQGSLGEGKPRLHSTRVH